MKRLASALFMLSVPAIAQAQTEPNTVARAANFRIETRSFTASDGDVLDACVAPGGPYKLLRFDTVVENWGNAHFIVGTVPAAGTSNADFEWDAGHGHHHARDFFGLDLFNDSDLTSVTSGLKKGFCLTSTDALTSPSAPRGPFACQPGTTMGISSMWADTYTSGLPCQYINVTNVPDGTYLLTAESNRSRTRTESDVFHNASGYRVTISGSTVSVADPFWRSSVQVIAATGGPHRVALTNRSIDKVDIFWRAADQKLYTKSKVLGSTWSADLPIFNASMPYTLAEGPSAISPKPDWLDVYGRNNGNGNIFHFFWRGGAWSYENMGGTGNSGTGSVSPSPDRQMVGVIWNDGSFRYRFWNGSSWTAWTSLGGSFSQDRPVFVSSGENTIHVFTKTPSQGVNYRRWVNGTWTPAWQTIAGTVAGPVSGASYNVNHVYLVGRAPNGQYMESQWAGTDFSAFSTAFDPGEMASAPWVVSSRPNRLDVFYYYDNGGTIFYRRRFWTGIGAWQVENPSVFAGISTQWPPVVNTWADGTLTLLQTQTDGVTRARERR